VGQALLPDSSVVSLRNAIAAVSGGRRDTMIVIRADRNTPHQAVMTVLDVAAGLGFTRITFATHEAGTRP
jgi:biopolymer transport protein ExbD